MSHRQRLKSAVYIHTPSTNPTEAQSMDDMTKREREHEEQYNWWLNQQANREVED